MTKETKRDLEKSKILFSKIQSEIERDLDCQIISVEGNGKLAEQLDMISGIDYLVKTENGLRGLASRMQISKCWETFTIRLSKNNISKTEYEKRKQSIQNDFIYPYYTLQAYFGENSVDYAICKTKGLYELIERYPKRTKQRSTSNANFIVVQWDDLGEDLLVKRHFKMVREG